LHPRTGFGTRILRVLAVTAFVLLLCSGTVTFHSSHLLAAPETGPAGDALQQRSRALRGWLLKLRTTARLMQADAHPDDEDGGMLAAESRGKGASVLLLTLNRGEGGQNRMGSNLLDVLGVLRTLELLAANDYYGVEQRFTRVADFGFSKNPEETFEKWHGHDPALGDMVRVIRTFRPDVLVSRFQGTARDGHGHHSAAGILTREAFRVAADPQRFPDQIAAGLAPWQPTKLYVGMGFMPETCPMSVDTTVVDPLLGISYAQYGLQGLRHQLSQGAGSFTPPPGGMRPFCYQLAGTAPQPGYTGNIAGPSDEPNAKPEHDFFDGIDTSLPGLAVRLGRDESAVPFLRPALIELAAQIDKAGAAPDTDPAAAAVPLLAGLRIARDLIAKVEKANLPASAKADLLVNLQTKQEQLEQAADVALGIELHASVETAPASSADDAFVAVPGQAFTLNVKLDNRGTRPITPKAVKLDLPKGWLAWQTSKESLAPIAPQHAASVQFRVDVPRDALLTRPYWHRDDPETDTVFTIDQPQFATLALPPPPVHAYVDYEAEGLRGHAVTAAEVAFRDANQELQEMPLAVEPPLSVALEPATQVVPLGTKNEVAVRVTVKSNLPREYRGSVEVQWPKEWTRAADKASTPVVLKPGPSRETVDFHIKPSDLRPGQTFIRASVPYDGKNYSEGYTVVARPDLRTFFYYQPAQQKVSIVDVKTPPGLSVGYIEGAGDDIPAVLSQVGFKVSMLSAQELADGDLSRYGTIVVGIRAYDTREDVRRYNQRLMDYVATGGTLLVQYNSNTMEFNNGHFTPYPATASRDRVTVEEAPVQILAPQQPIFHFPNEITAADFQGWVQERGLYFMSSWDARFVPLLESHDPGEGPLPGGMLYARHGTGIYIYTGYSFFRQLPAGVPGAIRLFVNLVSAGHEKGK
jgi:LmbE family N-acetylglucosaminyl deacetylase